MDTQVESSAEPDSAIINHDDRECNKADVESAVSSDLSDRDTLALFPPTRPVTPAIESEYRELGLTTIGSPPWNAKYDVITVHGLRDDHKHVWKSENGSPWLQQQLLSNIPSRQVDYLYATDSTARIFRPDGIELEAQNLLRLYAENRRLLSPSEVGRPIIWVCHDIGGCIVKQVLLEASKATLREKSIDLEASRTRIALHSSTIIFLGCPHRTMSIEIFEDELHNLLKLPGPDIETGFLRKIKNLAHQVCNINMLFLDGKFLSRFVYINVFAVKDFNVDETTTAENAILEPATHATLPSEVESDTRDGFCDETVSNVAGLEATDGPVEFSPDVPFVRSPDLRADQSNIQARSTAQLHSERDTLNHNQSCHAAWVDLPVGRASPFSRYTSDIYIMFDNVHADFHNDHASLTRGGPWVDIVQRQLRADQRYLGAHPPDLTNELALLYMAPCTKPPTVHHDPNVFKISFLKWIYAHEKFKTFDRSVGPYTLCIQGVKEDVARMAMVSQHLYLRTTISSIDGGDEDPSVAHGFLSEACLKYLMHEEVQPEYARLSIDSLGKNALKTPLLRQHDFLEYSVQFWAKHYHSCCPSNQPMALALRFFDTTNVRNKWAEAHYLLSNPFTRIHRGYFSSLPMTAALGLEDILSQQLADYGDSDWLTTDTWLAITEAARNGHNNIVYRLLENAALQESNLLDAINWAASSSNQLALARLLEKVALLGKFSWTRPLLQRAVALGHDSLISVLIGTEQYLDERDDLEMDQILREAISWEQQAAVKLLLESGVSIDTRDNNGRTVLHLSANMGQPEVVQMLLDAGADVNDKDSQGLSAIDIAINSGTHKALARLLEAGILNDNSKPEGSSFDVRGYLTRACNFGRIHCIRVLVEKLEHLEGGSDIDEILYTLCGFPHTADSCRFLIGRGAKPQQLHTEQEMLLHRALKTGDTDLIRLLVEKGAEMTYVDKQNDDTTPLSFAIWKCSLDVVELLLQMGASANYVPEDTDSPLFVACYQATDTRKVELLLKHGAEINWKKDDGWTALHGAYDLPAFVSILLDNGADVNGMSDYGTPLMMAARWNYVDVLKRLLAHSDIKVNLKFERDDDSKQEVTALFEAVEQGSHDCANLLIEAGAEIDERLGSAKFLLESAKLDGSEECSKMMRTFLNRGINIDNTDDEGNTTLHGVGSMTPVWIIQDMVERGAPIDSPNNDGLTPLGVTVERGNVAAAEYLISKGARVNIYGSRFGSLLHLAFQANRPENISFQLLKILIDAHADPNLPGPEPSRESLLYKVIRNINSGMEEKVVTYLVNNADPALDVNAPGGSQSHPIMAAAYTGKRRILEYLVRHGANVQVRDDLGRQTIHYLSGRGRWNYIMRPIRILDKSGADLMAKDSFGRTALHFLAGSDDVTLLEFFLRRLPKGHDIDLKDDDGWTPLMWACRTSDETMIINILVRDHGADIWAKSYDGEWSARKLACLSNQSEYSRGLLEPAEHEREREGTDGSKEIWDPAFHSIPPGTNHPSAPWCNSCFVIMVGARYKCFVCDDYDLCFKCYPQRTDMHDEYHDFGEYHEDAFLYQDESNTSETDQSVDDESRASDEAGATSDAPHVDAGDGGDGSLRSEHSDL
ncbi:Serine/threonine-protein phosphatase 6 regulatory ankyrin repeat subunit A [Colletotrichum fructicola]|nr:Serine/threonine-protein phosphatase 6 regulatory ankyrin repeat subunit A [Colletotrichum fructicola]